MKRSNLLLVFADQMRGMDMHCAGNAQIQTPNMDRLARMGVLCSRHFATTPVCGPNRATLLTGMYPTSHRVLGNDLALPSEIPTLGTILKSEGYSTGYIGKWHLDGLPRGKWTPPGARRFGFDFWAAYNCTHEYFDAKYFRDAPELIRQNGYEPQVQTDLALEFLKSQNQEKPFALVLSWGPPHNPYEQVPENFRAMYAPNEIELRPNVVEKTDNPLAKGMKCRRATADYYAAISALDEQLGRLLDALEANGQAENTLIVFTSDHGDMLWSHGWMQKQLPFEESVHVPLLFSLSGRIPAARVWSTPGATVDLTPTILGLMEVDIPKNIEGRDWSTPIRELKEVGNDDGVLLTNYLVSDQAVAQNVPQWRGLRTERFLYAEKFEDGARVPWLLFDMEIDALQQHNLVNLPEHRALQSDLQRRLNVWLQRTGDEFDGEKKLLTRLHLQDDWAARQTEMSS